MDKIKNIVACGLYNGWSYNDIISQIMFMIANGEELELLELWCSTEELPELKAIAEELYNKYRAKYYDCLV